jgi:uncharacterized protein (DUF697 family)
LFLKRIFFRSTPLTHVDNQPLLYWHSFGIFNHTCKFFNYNFFIIKLKCMHNLSNEYFQSEFETGPSYESNYELSPEYEYSNEYAGESAYELSPEFETMNAEFEVVQSELAQELMEINNEYEFGAWLKRLGKKAAGVASSFLNSPIGQQATAALGDIAKKTLPSLAGKAAAWAGGKIGGLVGQADYGRQLGQQYGSQAGQSVADRYPDFVKFATDALSRMSQEFEAGAAPAIKPAIVKAARKHYPIILKVKGTLHVRPVGGGMNNEFEYNEWTGETANEMQGEIANNEGTFNEVTEMELASELLNIQSEAELDRFFGGLFKKAVGAVSNFAKSGAGKALGGMLKGIAKKVLPLAGGALGSFIPIPGVGTALGSALGTAASNLFELELEGLSAEDREFEMARAYVRFAGNAARRASRMGYGQPGNAARQAIMQAARRYAPGLLVRDYRQGNYNSNDGQSNGTWYREGNRIVIEGA